LRRPGASASAFSAARIEGMHMLFHTSHASISWQIFASVVYLPFYLLFLYLDCPRACPVDGLALKIDQNSSRFNKFRLNFADAAVHERT
jgi:hypothetical protein